MGANAGRQVLTAVRAQIRVAEKAREKLVRPEAPGTRHALPDGVVPAVFVEKSPLFETESARPAAVKVDHAATVPVDGVLGRERLPTSGAGRLRLHLPLRGDSTHWSPRFPANRRMCAPQPQKLRGQRDFTGPEQNTRRREHTACQDRRFGQDAAAATADTR